MKKPTATIISYYVLAFAMLAVGCSAQPVNQPDDSIDTVTDSEATTTAPAVEVRDFGGYEFNILVHTKGTPGSMYQHLDFGWSDENAGELINDAVYARNLVIEERYNATINSIEADDPYNMGKNAILAGTNEYDVIMPTIYQSFSLAEEELLTDVNTLGGLDITNEWWDPAVVRDLSLCDRLYVLTGDISMADEEFNSVIYFSKQLVDEFGLDDPYQLVRDNKWTIDQLHSMGKAVTYDLNGDNKLDENDVYGFLTDYSGAAYIYFGLGGKMVELDSDGKPVLIMGDDHTFDAMDKLTALFYDNETLLNATDIPGRWQTFNQMLMAGRALFRDGSIYNIAFYRDMEKDFGVLPFPKLNSEQEEYCHLVSTEYCPVLCIPKNPEDQLRTGLLLEALASESRETVMAAYYDVSLTKKLTRDTESGEMLDIIFSTKCYDLAMTFKWGGLENVIIGSVRKGGNFASLFESAKSKAIAEMEKTYELFE